MAAVVNDEPRCGMLAMVLALAALWAVVAGCVLFCVWASS